VLLMILLSALVLLACGQIVLRDVFSIGFTWTDGLIRLAVLWLALIGAIAAGRDRKHIAIDVLSRALPARLRHVAGVVTNLFTAGVTGTMTWYAWAFVADSRSFGDVLLGDSPAWVFQVILPVGFGLISYRYLVRAVQQIAETP
jgi:TRAP-type C4-dicarboxylate transport system permease small subunit